MEYTNIIPSQISQGSWSAGRYYMCVYEVRDGKFYGTGWRMDCGSGSSSVSIAREKAAMAAAAIEGIDAVAARMPEMFVRQATIDERERKSMAFHEWAVTRV